MVAEKRLRLPWRLPGALFSHFPMIFFLLFLRFGESNSDKSQLLQTRPWHSMMHGNCYSVDYVGCCWKKPNRPGLGASWRAAARLALANDGVLPWLKVGPIRSTSNYDLETNLGYCDDIYTFKKSRQDGLFLLEFLGMPSFHFAAPC